LEVTTTTRKATAIPSSRRAALPPSLEQSLAKVEDPALKAAIADAAAYSLGRRTRRPAR
jgi:hypothetical protein